MEKEEDFLNDEEYILKPCTYTAKVFNLNVNLNGVRYTENSLKEAVKKYKDKSDSSAGSFGELGGSAVLDHRVFKTVLLSNISHKIVDTKYDATSKNVYAEILPLDTPSGKILKEALESKCGCRFALRALGTRSTNAAFKIDQIISYDIVPSYNAKYLPCTEEPTTSIAASISRIRILKFKN